MPHPGFIQASCSLKGRLSCPCNRKGRLCPCSRKGRLCPCNRKGRLCPCSRRLCPCSCTNKWPKSMGMSHTNFLHKQITGNELHAELKFQVRHVKRDVQTGQIRTRRGRTIGSNCGSKCLVCQLISALLPLQCGAAIAKARRTTSRGAKLA